MIYFRKPPIRPENIRKPSQSAITCSRLTIETLEQVVKYV